MGAEIAVEWLGRVPYREALAMQERRVEERRRGLVPDVLWLLEHPPVLTHGRRAHRDHLLASPAWLAQRGVEVHEVSRGGDFTYHGPGQLVGYPIVDLEARGAPDVVAFLRRLEAGLIEALGALGVPARARAGYTGVFVAEPAASPGARPRKIASIGVGVRGWVTYHGFALNVDCDLRAFEWIVPCGLEEVEMTSIERELGGRMPAPARVREIVAEALVPQLGASAAREVA